MTSDTCAVYGIDDNTIGALAANLAEQARIVGDDDE